MVAYAPYIAGTASLSSFYHGLPTAYSDCQLATITVYEYAEATATIEALPTTYTTASVHGHGGPYYNPYNDLPLPYNFPGQPTDGEIYAPPKPSAPFQYGGLAKDDYEAPAWIPKGTDKLISSLPKGKQNGDSYWGDINCPHLPLSGLPSGSSHPSSYTSSGAYPPYPSLHPSASGYPSYSGNSTYPSGTGIHPSGTGIHPSGTAVSNSGVTASTAYSSSTVTVSTSYSSTTTSKADAACPTMPDTGVTRTYDMHVAYQTIAPDGVTRNGLLVNGQFPGPLVEANWGDWLLFKITNELTDEGTALHAHGLFQANTSWYDGVPAVAQCPITPNGGTFEMLFRADRYGTSCAQYNGGAHGPLVIYGPQHAEYDIDLGPVMVEDWYHADYYTLVKNVMSGSFPASNNNLINGKMQYPCANTTLPCESNAGIAKFKFQSGKKHLIRLINAGSEGLQKFSIDGHTLTVVAVDFIPVEPYTTNVVTLGIAQRTDVIVEAIGAPGDAYWMRSQLGTERCVLNDGISPNALAAVYYEDADTDSVPATTSDVTAAQLAVCKNDDLTLGIPLCKIPLEEPTTTQDITFDFKSNGTNFIWFVDNQTYRGDYNQPILLQANKGDLDYKPEWNVYNFGSNKTVRIHLINNGLIGGHPMHLHGHDFHVLAEGFGDWDGTVTNPENTVRRDVHMLQNAQNTTAGVVPSFMVLQFNQDNPGVWPLHCHLAWHVSGGLFLNVLERPDDIMDEVIDDDVFEGCRTWQTYTDNNIPNQIDSGLRKRAW